MPLKTERMTSQNRNLIIWLSIVCVVIYAMIVVGGLTRLTQSGLSMVDWRPIMGVIPPLTQADWQATFDAYKAYPEYRQINQGMSLTEFKGIFYWEYGHRVLGRVIGMIYFLPLVVFLVLNQVESRWVPRLWVGFILGGLQGLMGWYMVKSGLVDIPHVSHYRLAAHLSLALLILIFLFWLILDMAGVRKTGSSLLVMRFAWLSAGLLAVQFVLGAFTAGLDAGREYNSWPDMDGQFLNDAALALNPLWLNFVENGAMIQFIHRWLGALLLISVITTSVLALREDKLEAAAMSLLVVTSLQFLLGILTLVNAVPVGLGSLHQAVACLMVLSLTYFLYIAREPGSVS